MHRILGIDLGTTNSVAAYMSRGLPQPVEFISGERFFPSVISIGRSGKLDVGTRAKGNLSNKIYSAKRFIGRRFSDPEVQSALKTMNLPYQVFEGVDGMVKLSLDGKTFSPTEVAALVLQNIKTAAENQLQGEFSRAIITVPAYFREGQIAATREAGRQAGFHVVQIISEPTAAALAFGARNSRIAQDKLILVCDFGGGTFDVSLLMPSNGVYTVLDIGGDAFLGGDDIDQLLVDHIRNEIIREQHIDVFDSARSNEAKVILKQEAERIKIGLSSSLVEVAELPAISGINAKVEVRRKDLERLIENIVQRSIDTTMATLMRSNFAPDDIDQVLLIGGTTKIPYFRRRLEDLFGAEKIQSYVEPMLSVAEGAAVLSAIVRTIDCEKCMTANDIERDQCAMCDAPLYGVAKDPGPWQGSKGDVVRPTVRCPECHTESPSGKPQCPKCGYPLPAEIADITAHSIGIELQDGSFAKIIPSRTYVPMEQSKSEVFRTSVKNQRRLEINIYEGENPIARSNELLGSIDVHLNGSHPQGTPILIALRVDKNRLTEVSVQIDPPTGITEARKLKRSQLTKRLKDDMVDARQAMVSYMNVWKAEVTAEEANSLQTKISEIDSFINGDGLDQLTIEQIDERRAAAARLIKISIFARDMHAHLSQLNSRAAGLVPENRMLHIRSTLARLKEVRERAEWEAMEELSSIARQAIDSIGSYMNVVLAEAYANDGFLGDGRLSPALAARINNIGISIRQAVHINNQVAIQTGLNELDMLWPELEREIEQHVQTTGATLPSK